MPSAPTGGQAERGHGVAQLASHVAQSGSPGDCGDGAMREAFEHALREHPKDRSELWYTFAGRPVRLRVVGRELAALVQRPFSHLRLPVREPVQPDLCVDIWDQAATGVARPDVSRVHHAAAPVSIDASPDGRVVSFEREATRLSFDRAERRIVGCVAGADQLSQLDRGRPFRDPLLLWHQDRGVETVHAALVARDGHGILFGGAGGAGKTSTALACLQSGFTYLSDDYVGLETVGPQQFIGHSLFCSAHLEPHQAAKFPSLRAHAQAPNVPQDDKSLLILSEVFPDRLGCQAQVRVLALPSIHKETRHTTYRVASKAEALLSLAPSSLLMQPASAQRQRGFEKLVAMVESVPVYRLDLGNDLGRIPSCVESLLHEATR